MKNNRKWFLTLVFAVPLVVIFSQCLTSGNEKPDPRGDIFAGSASCIKCHKNVYDNYIHTDHFTTSRSAFANIINGSFTDNVNTFYFNKYIKIVMKKPNNKLFKLAYFKGQLVGAAPF